MVTRMTPPTTNTPPDMTPRGGLGMRERDATTHRSIPKAINTVPRVLLGRAVLRNRAIVRRRLRILTLREIEVAVADKLCVQMSACLRKDADPMLYGRGGGVLLTTVSTQR
jgi:hypothetical protein